MARWGRAQAILRRTVPAGERVLDLGCAFGFGTLGLARTYDTDGLDASPEYIRRARRRAQRRARRAGARVSPLGLPSPRFTLGRTEQLPYPDAHFAAVVFLDVLEHVSDERASIAEIARVLRPGGLLVLSVPHTGLLRWADALNVYAWLTGEDALAPPGTPAGRETYHRHYSAGAIRHLLGDRFKICYVQTSGLGLAEIAHLPLLLLAKRLLRADPLYALLQYLYFGLYVLEDLLPLPAHSPLRRYGYHLTVVARRVVR